MRKIRPLPYITLIAALILVSTGCIKKIALKKVAGALTAEGSTVFTGDNDPQLIADALPFALKTYESLLEGLPDDVNLLLATGKAFCMYAYAFIHVPADTISDIRSNEKTTLLPVVVLTTSSAEADVIKGYELGANAYVKKPVKFDDFLEAAGNLGLFWLLLNVSPNNPSR